MQRAVEFVDRRRGRGGDGRFGRSRPAAARHRLSLPPDATTRISMTRPPAGGTSEAPRCRRRSGPGLIAIADQINGGGLGLINLALYRIGADPARYAADFFDVTTGNNTDTDTVDPPTPVTGYPATPGWNPVTGPGTPTRPDTCPTWSPQRTATDPTQRRAGARSARPATGNQQSEKPARGAVPGGRAHKREATKARRGRQHPDRLEEAWNRALDIVRRRNELGDYPLTGVLEVKDSCMASQESPDQQAVSAKWLQEDLNEHAWRYSHRDDPRAWWRGRLGGAPRLPWARLAMTLTIEVLTYLGRREARRLADADRNEVAHADDPVERRLRHTQDLADVLHRQQRLQRRRRPGRRGRCRVSGRHADKRAGADAASGARIEK